MTVYVHDDAKLDGKDGLVDDKNGLDESDEYKKQTVMRRRPYTPTQRDIDEQAPPHLPYRSWCSPLRGRQGDIWPSCGRVKQGKARGHSKP